MTEAPQPPHPLPAMTTYELRDYRKLLEHSLNDKVIGQAPIAADLRARLELVTAEEAERIDAQETDRLRRTARRKSL